MNTDFLLPDCGHETAVGDGVLIGADFESEFFHEVAVFARGIALALGDVGDEGGVFGDGERPGLVIVDEGFMDDEQSAGGQGVGGFFEKGSNFREVPIVQNIG